MTIAEREIAGCFGAQDMLFAIHPMDAGRAFELLRKLRREEVSWLDVRSDFERFLRSKGCGKEHIKAQIAAAELHFAPWLWGGLTANTIVTEMVNTGLVR
jgi:hypothetical protein